MTDAPEPPPEPAESRAIELLRLVGGHTPAVSERFTTDLVVRAHRQRAIAVQLRALGAFAAAIATAFVTGLRPSRRA